MVFHSTQVWTLGRRGEDEQVSRAGKGLVGNPVRGNIRGKNGGSCVVYSGDG